MQQSEVQHDKREPGGGAQQEPFVLALDCGETAEEEIADYQHAVAYVRARRVWQVVQEQMLGRGNFLSARTMATYGRFYCIVYGRGIAPTVQREAFRILDRFRQQYAAAGATFAQVPPEMIVKLFEMRSRVARGQSPGIYSQTENGGLLHVTHDARVEAFEAGRPVAIAPPFESVPLDLWYLCLEYGEAMDLAEARYLQVRDRVRESHAGVGAQRVLIGNHVYVTVLGMELASWAKKRFTRLLLELHSRDGVEFVTLPEKLLGQMLPAQAELMAKVSRDAPFAESHLVSSVEVAEGEASAIERREPPVLEEEADVQTAHQRRTIAGGAGGASKKRPFLERYLTTSRVRFERAAAGVAQRGGGAGELAAMTMTHRAIRLAALSARYYHFENSALAMADRLVREWAAREGDSMAIAQLPELHVLVRYESPIELGVYEPVHGVFFADPLRAFQQLAAQEREGGGKARGSGDCRAG